jgi:hypothetical protein
VQSALVNYALATPNTFSVGNYYHIPNLGNGHRTGNGYRWLGAMGGRVMGQVIVNGLGWEPLRPIQSQWQEDDSLLLGFHVPGGKLTTHSSYINADPQDFDDLGFTMADKDGYVACKVSLAADQVVQFVPARTVDQASATLAYADYGGYGGPRHYGLGNLCDTNELASPDVYAYPDQDSTVNGATSPDNGAPLGTNFDIPEFSGLPYPGRNFCVGFQITPSTFTGTIGNGQGN